MSKKNPSELERAFDTQFRRLGQDLPRPEPYHKFAPGRGFEFDRAFPEFMVAVELEGMWSPAKFVKCHACGTPVRARKKDGSLGKRIRHVGYHQQVGRFKSDKVKYNMAVELGWDVLRFVYDDVHGDPFSMVQSIRKVINRNRYILPPLDVEGKHELTERESTILHYIAAGYTGPEIAERLHLVSSTVRGHTARIRSKMLVGSQASAVARAICWGYIRIDKIPWKETVPEIFDLEDDEL